MAAWVRATYHIPLCSFGCLRAQYPLLVATCPWWRFLVSSVLLSLHSWSPWKLYQLFTSCDQCSSNAHFFGCGLVFLTFFFVPFFSPGFVPSLTPCLCSVSVRKGGRRICVPKVSKCSQCSLNLHSVPNPLSFLSSLFQTVKKGGMSDKVHDAVHKLVRETS